MVSWAKDATEFIVSVSFMAGAGSSYGCISKYVLFKLSNSKIKYSVKDGRFWSAISIYNDDPSLLISRICPRVGMCVQTTGAPLCPCPHTVWPVALK